MITEEALAITRFARRQIDMRLTADLNATTRAYSEGQRRATQAAEFLIERRAPEDAWSDVTTALLDVLEYLGADSPAHEHYVKGFRIETRRIAAELIARGEE